MFIDKRSLPVERQEQCLLESPFSYFLFYIFCIRSRVGFAFDLNNIVLGPTQFVDEALFYVLVLSFLFQNDAVRFKALV